MVFIIYLIVFILVQAVLTPGSFQSSLALPTRRQTQTSISSSSSTTNGYNFTFTQTSATSDLTWFAVASNSNGQYLAAVVNSGGGIWTSNNSGSSWTQTSANISDWYSITSDSTGQYLAAASYALGVATSSNYGQSWIQIYPDGPTAAAVWFAIASDSTGQYLAVVNGDYGTIWTSSTFGSTWSLAFTNPTLGWTSITSDSTGRYLAACSYGGGIYISLNYGSTWTQSDAPTGDWEQSSSITSSSSGQYLAAASSVTNIGIWISSNYGRNWTQSAAPTDQAWWTVTSDNTGQYLAAAVNGGYIWTSADYGSSWSQQITSSTKQWSCIASDSSGQFLVAAGENSAGIWTATAVNSSSSSSSVQPSLTPTLQPSFSSISTYPTIAVTEAPSSLQPSMTPTSAQPNIFATSFPSLYPTVVAASPSTLQPVNGGSSQSPTSTATSTSVPSPLSSASPSQQPTIVVESAPSVAPSAVANTSTTTTATPTSSSTASTFGGDNNDDSILSSSDSATLSAVLGIIVFAVTMIALCWRYVYGKRYSRINSHNQQSGSSSTATVISFDHLSLNESKSMLVETVDLALRSFNIVNSFYQVIYAQATANEAARVAMGISRAAYFVIGTVFIIRLAWSPQLYGLLNRQSLCRLAGGVSIHAMLLVVSLLDAMAIRLLPWNGTEFTALSGGYPDVFTMRLVVHGSIVATAAQVLAVLLPLTMHATTASSSIKSSYPALYYLTVLYSVINLLRSMASAVLTVMLARDNDLKVAVLRVLQWEALQAALNGDSKKDADKEDSECDEEAGVGSQEKKDEAGTIAALYDRSSVIEMTISSFAMVVPPDREEEKETIHNPLQQATKHQEEEEKEEEEAGEKQGEDDEEEEAGEEEKELEEWSKREAAYLATIAFPDENIDLLRQQLKISNIAPLEYIPLAKLEEEIAAIINCMNRGEAVDEGRLDHLLRCLDMNPEYIAQKKEQLQAWRLLALPYCAECLAVMRGFMPPNIFAITEKQLETETTGKWTFALRKRIWSKKVLWLLRLSETDVQRLHEADLHNHYNYQGQGLDVVEVAALYAIMPAQFSNDSSGRKEKWRAGLEQTLCDMMKQNELGKLPRDKQRSGAYNKQPALYEDRHSLHNLHAISGEDAFRPRRSFLELVRANNSSVDGVEMRPTVKKDYVEKKEESLTSTLSLVEFSRSSASGSGGGKVGVVKALQAALLKQQARLGQAPPS